MKHSLFTVIMLVSINCFGMEEEIHQERALVPSKGLHIIPYQDPIAQQFPSDKSNTRDYLFRDFHFISSTGRPLQPSPLSLLISYGACIKTPDQNRFPHTSLPCDTLNEEARELQGLLNYEKLYQNKLEWITDFDLRDIAGRGLLSIALEKKYRADLPEFSAEFPEALFDTGEPLPF